MGVWFHRIPKGRRKRPAWASEGMWKEMSGSFTVRMFGFQYELPINEYTEPFIKLLEGHLDPWSKADRRSEFRRTQKVERGITDFVNAILIQVRDTSVAEAAGLLAQDIKSRLEPLLENKIHQNIERLKASGLPGPEPTPEHEKETP